MARIVTISGGKEVKRGVTHATAGSKVDKRSGFYTAKDWSDSGRWVRVKSSWVQAIKYDREEKELSVQFRDATCVYPNTSIQTAQGMFRAASMGKYVHAHLYDKPYFLAR